ncbi:hypothetical protein [Cognatilysobacter bugurensis]|uniref:Uncharacterized protein n=1 Tax=Cognatilysobacter bugurensis TaxID=543356 RepID=A0A918WAH4_9GAMM|nr:hypothetical protein [Lysobacter bugurensis]GHA83547.1 hypothetical protein GCM10007067_22080 [Lysobacter bugurensis]
MIAVEPPAPVASRRRARLPIALGAMIASLVGALLFPFMAYAHRSPLWPVLGVAVVALAGALGGGLYHALQHIPLQRTARGLGVIVYVAVTAAAFIAVLDSPG